MKYELIVPIVLIVLNALASIGFLIAGDKMKAGYFISAAFITYFASF